MTNVVIQDVEQFFEGLWSKLAGHVKPIALADAKAVLDEAKTQVAALGTEAEQDLAKDATEVTGDAAAVAGAAETGLSGTPAQS